MKQIQQLYIFFFFLGIFFLPFNSQPPEFLSILGEFQSDSSPLFFMLGFFVLLCYDLLRGKFYFPFWKSPFFFFLIFFLFLFIGFAWNFSSIETYYFKQTSGPERFIKQIISAFLSAFVFFYLFINVCHYYGAERFFKIIRKVSLWSLIIVAIVGVFQFAITTLGMGFLKPIFEIFKYLPFAEPKLDYKLLRVSSVTYEPPALGTYLITISGFMFSYIFTEKKAYKYIPFVLVVFMALISKSRTAFVVILIQVICGVYFSYMNYQSIRKLMHRSVFVLVIIATPIIIINQEVIMKTVQEKIDSLNFIENRSNKKSDNAVSNKSRLGIQYANWIVFKRNPIVGVGWGQQAYEAKRYYPIWAKRKNYEFRYRYLNERVKSFPPGYNLYLRILTETGIVGFILFCGFLAVLFIELFSYLRKINSQDRYLIVCLIIMFIGFLLNWLQIDSFRVYGFWICLAILMNLKYLKTEDNSKAVVS